MERANLIINQLQNLRDQGVDISDEDVNKVLIEHSPTGGTEQPEKNSNNVETPISKNKRSSSQALSSEKKEKQKLSKTDYIPRYLQSPNNSPNRFQFSANEEFDMEVASNIMEGNFPPPSPSKNRGAILREKN